MSDHERTAHHFEFAAQRFENVGEDRSALPRDGPQPMPVACITALQRARFAAQELQAISNASAICAGRTEIFASAELAFVVFGGGIEFLPGVPDRRSGIDSSGWSENRFQLLDLRGEPGLRGFEEDIDLRLHAIRRSELQSGVRQLRILNREHEALRFAGVARQTRDRARFFRQRMQAEDGAA